MKIPKFLKRRRHARNRHSKLSDSMMSISDSDYNDKDNIKLLDDFDDEQWFCFDPLVVLDTDGSTTLLANKDNCNQAGNCKASSSCSTLSTDTTEVDDASNDHLDTCTPTSRATSATSPTSLATPEDSTLATTSAMSPASASSATSKSTSSILKLTNYVADQKQWDMPLLESRMVDHSCHSLLLVDSIPAKNFRRWQFLKTRLCRQLIPLMQKHQEQWKTVQFQSTLQIPLDICDKHFAIESVINLLSQVQQDVDIVELQFQIEEPEEGSATGNGTANNTASLNDTFGADNAIQDQAEEDLQTLMLALIGLLSLKDRSWQGVTFSGLTLDNDNPHSTFHLPDSISQHIRRIVDEASVKFGVPFYFRNPGM